MVVLYEMPGDRVLVGLFFVLIKVRETSFIGTNASWERPQNLKRFYGLVCALSGKKSNEFGMNPLCYFILEGEKNDFLIAFLLGKSDN